MKRIQLITLLILSVVISGCEPSDSKLTIVNETNSLLVYMPSNSDTITGDTPADGNHFLPRHDEKHVTVLGNWESTVRNNFNGKLWIITFDSDTLEKYGWEDIKANDRYYSKQEFHIE